MGRPALSKPAVRHRSGVARLSARLPLRRRPCHLRCYFSPKPQGWKADGFAICRAVASGVKIFRARGHRRQKNHVRVQRIRSGCRESDIEQSTIDRLPSLNRWSMAALNWNSGKGGDGRSLSLCPINWPTEEVTKLQNGQFSIEAHNTPTRKEEKFANSRATPPSAKTRAAKPLGSTDSLEAGQAKPKRR